MYLLPKRERKKRKTWYRKKKKIGTGRKKESIVLSSLSTKHNATQRNATTRHESSRAPTTHKHRRKNEHIHIQRNWLTLATWFWHHITSQHNRNLSSPTESLLEQDVRPVLVAAPPVRATHTHHNSHHRPTETHRSTQAHKSEGTSNDSNLLFLVLGRDNPPQQQTTKQPTNQRTNNQRTTNNKHNNNNDNDCEHIFCIILPSVTVTLTVAVAVAVTVTVAVAVTVHPACYV